MSIKKILIGLAAALIFGIAALFVVPSVLSQGPALPPGDYDLEAGQYVFNVPELQATPVAPTDTPIPDTPVPPTDTPVPSGHDDRAWHPVSADIAHEHKGYIAPDGSIQGPEVLDDIFGTEFYTLAGGSISYPWQTFAGAEANYEPPPADPDLMENALKHEGYGWIIHKDEPCALFGSGEGCITDLRLQYHGIFAPHGWTTRFHSFAAEARLCNLDESQCGTILVGGHVDFEKLLVNGQHVPLPNDPPPEFIGSNPAREHGPTGGFASWYGPGQAERGHKIFRFAITMFDTWAGVNVNDPLEFNMTCPDFQCEQNGSTIKLRTFNISLGPEFDADGDGLLNYDGYMDRYGNLVSGCSAPSVDCAPLKIVNVPVVDPGGSSFVFQNNQSGKPDFDISPPGEFWIEYPN